MVRLSVLALFALSVTSVLARPTHHRRNQVCSTAAPAETDVDVVSTKKAKATATVTSRKATQTSKKGDDEDVEEDDEEYVDDDDEEEDDEEDSGDNEESTGDDEESTGGDEETDDNSSSDAPSGSTGALKSLFPVPIIKSKSWSTSKLVDGALPLNMNTLGKLKGNANVDVVTFSGKSAIKAFMKKGSINPGNKNAPAPPFSFYSPGPMSLSGKEVLFSYSVFFEQGYAFNQGGKLPGFFGGTDNNVAATCSGGRHNDNCWSARLMWRKNGQGEFYGYLPVGEGKNGQKCGRNASGACRSEYGMSIGTGAWTWPTGRWTTVAQRVKLNDVGKANGEVEIYIDGKSVLHVDELTYRTSASSITRGLQMQIFFGGHDSSWASPKDQNVYFADLSAAVIA